MNIKEIWSNFCDWLYFYVDTETIVGVLFIIVIAFLPVLAWDGLSNSMNIIDCWSAEVVGTNFVEGNPGTDTRVGFSSDGQTVVIPGTPGTSDKTQLVVYISKLDRYESVDADTNTLYQALKTGKVSFIYGKSKIFKFTKTTVSLQSCNTILEPNE